eukprot:scaffold2830_cov173-Amphora_coffeaeformis.AAC.3
MSFKEGKGRLVYGLVWTRRMLRKLLPTSISLLSTTTQNEGKTFCRSTSKHEDSYHPFLGCNIRVIPMFNVAQKKWSVLDPVGTAEEEEALIL